MVEGSSTAADLSFTYLHSYLYSVETDFDDIPPSMKILMFILSFLFPTLTPSLFSLFLIRIRIEYSFQRLFCGLIQLLLPNNQQPYSSVYPPKLELLHSPSRSLHIYLAAIKNPCEVFSSYQGGQPLSE